MRRWNTRPERIRRSAGNNPWGAAAPMQPIRLAENLRNTGGERRPNERTAHRGRAIEGFVLFAFDSGPSQPAKRPLAAVFASCTALMRRPPLKSAGGLPSTVRCGPAIRKRSWTVLSSSLPKRMPIMYTWIKVRTTWVRPGSSTRMNEFMAGCCPNRSELWRDRSFSWVSSGIFF
jgi:hypothetical protein